MRTPEELGKVLKKLREDEDIPQKDMAQRCGVTQAIWSRLERGQHRLTLPLLEQLAQGVGLSLEVLLDLPQHPLDLQEWIALGSQLSPTSRQLLRPLFEHLRFLEQQIRGRQALSEPEEPPDESPREEPPHADAGGDTG